jgi:hypothetical protein
VRLSAATVLPEEGRTALLALARGFRLDEAIQAGAIAALGRPPARGMSRILGAAIRQGRRRVALEAISALGLSGSRTALAPLALLTRDENSAFRVAAIRARATRQPGARWPRSVLGSEPSEGGAAESLPPLGTVTAAPSVRLSTRIRGALGLGVPPGHRYLPRKANQLSIADEAGAGALSLTGAETGQLSLGPESAPPGSLALPGAPRKTPARSAGSR